MKRFTNRTPLRILLAAIILLATFLRLFRLRDYLPFLGDEGRDALVWLHMVRDGEFTFLGPTASVGGFYLGPIYYYMALPFYWVWQDPVGPAYFVALVGVATVWLVYHVGRRWFGEIAGLTASFIYAIASLVVRYSRSSWNPNPLPFFSLLGAYWVATGVRERKWWKILGAGVCLGIAWQLHYLALILVPVFVVIVLVELFVLKGPTLQQGRTLSSVALRFSSFSFLSFFFLLLGWSLGFSMFLAFEIYHNFPNTRTVIEFVTRPQGSVLDWEPFGLIRSIVRNVNRLYFTVFSWPDTIVNKILALVSVSLGALFAVSRKQPAPLHLDTVPVQSKRENDIFQQKVKTKSSEEVVMGYAFLVWFFLGISIFSLYQGSIADYYFGFLFPVPALLIGASVQKLFNWKRKWMILAIIALGVLTIDQFMRWPFVKNPNRLLEQTENVAREVSNLSGGTRYNFALITGGNSDHAYRYFLERMGRRPTPLEEMVTDQLIAVCEKPKQDCQPLGNSVWEVAGFGRAEVVGERTVPPGLTIYRMVHHENSMEMIGRPAKKG